MFEQLKKEFGVTDADRKDQIRHFDKNFAEPRKQKSDFSLSKYLPKMVHQLGRWIPAHTLCCRGLKNESINKTLIYQWSCGVLAERGGFEPPIRV